MPIGSRHHAKETSLMCTHWLHFSAMKDVGIRIRVQRELREQFVAACKAEDKPAAQVLREFMRSYVDAHAPLVRIHHTAAHDNNTQPSHLEL